MSGDRDQPVGHNPDPIDQASEITDFMTERAVEEQRRLSAPQTHPLFDGVHCVEEECGEEIPAPRLALGRVRCVSCQERAEKSDRARPARWS